METILIEKIDKEQSETVQAILKALKVKYKVTGDASEAKSIAKSFSQGYREMLEVKAGKSEARDARDLFDEL